jgi:hypothetical protein
VAAAAIVFHRKLQPEAGDAKNYPEQYQGRVVFVRHVSLRPCGAQRLVKSQLAYAGFAIEAKESVELEFSD